MKKTFFPALFAIGLIAGPAKLLAQMHTNIVYVNQYAPSSSQQTGANWANAYFDLQDALTAVQPTANTVVEFWVAGGTYYPVTPQDELNPLAALEIRYSSFNLASHLHIRGGFNGWESSPDQRGGLTLTVLSGDIGTPMVNPITSSSNPLTLADQPFDPNDPGLADNCYNVIRGTDCTDVVLDSLVITGGCANGTNFYSFQDIQAMSVAAPIPDDFPVNQDPAGEAEVDLDPVLAGGGLFVSNQYMRTYEKQLAVTGCTFINNYTSGYGGAVALKDTQAEILFCNFYNNQSEQEGGAIYGQNQYSSVFGCAFGGNASAFDGGALYFESFPSWKTMIPGNVLDFLPQNPTVDELSAVFVVAVGGTLLNEDQFFSDTITATKMANNTRVCLNGTVQAEEAGEEGSFASDLFYKTLPANPVAKVTAVIEADGAADTTVAALGVAGNVYGLLTVSVTVGNLINDKWGNPNSTAYKNWQIFANGFNTYATPAGWITLLINAITTSENNQLQEEQAESLRQRAVATKSQEASQYNWSDYSTIVDCTFTNNESGLGGAAGIFYDNVQIENSVFEQNVALSGGGALDIEFWNSPFVFNCGFYQNSCRTNGTSAAMNLHNSRTKFINCTFNENYAGGSSTMSNGCAVSSELGADIVVANSILWGNTNPALANGGADLLVVTTNMLSATNYNAYIAADADDCRWIGQCDLRNSCVQSLNILPQGSETFFIYDFGTWYV